MKTRITLLIVLVLVAVCPPLRAQRSLDMRGDTLVIARDGDTLRLAGSAALQELVGMLDDTLVNVAPDGDMERENRQGRQRGVDFALQSQRIWADVAQDIVRIITTGIVFLVLAVLLFSYLKRRRKYRMVERAVENNYPLPPYVFNDAAAQPGWGYTAAPPTGASAAAPVQAGEYGGEDAQPTPPPLDQPGGPWSQPQPGMVAPHVNWRAFYGSFVLVVIGLGMMLMSSDLRGIWLMLVLIGLGKAFLTYQDQRDAIDAWRRK